MKNRNAHPASKPTSSSVVTNHRTTIPLVAAVQTALGERAGVMVFSTFFLFPFSFLIPNDGLGATASLSHDPFDIICQ